MKYIIELECDNDYANKVESLINKFDSPYFKMSVTKVKEQYTSVIGDKSNDVVSALNAQFEEFKGQNVIYGSNFKVGTLVDIVVSKQEYYYVIVVNNNKQYLSCKLNIKKYG
jgi:hypothetical protein